MHARARTIHAIRISAVAGCAHYYHCDTYGYYACVIVIVIVIVVVTIAYENVRRVQFRRGFAKTSAINARAAIAVPPPPVVDDEIMSSRRFAGGVTSNE